LHHEPRQPDGEIVDYTAHSLLEPMQAISRRKGNDVAIVSGPAVVFITFQDAREQIELGKRIREAAGELLPSFEPAAQKHNREVCDEREIAARTRELAEPLHGVERTFRHFGEQASRRIVNKSSSGIQQRERDMVQASLFEGPEAAFLVPVLAGLYLLADIGMGRPCSVHKCK